MTTTRERTTTDALAPVREALLRRAREDAQRLLADADQAAAATLAAARHEAAEIRAAARAQGEADAGSVLAGERARLRRRARAMTLGAQGAAYEQLREG